MRDGHSYFRKRSPFLGLFASLAIGIVLHWYLEIKLTFWIYLGSISLLLFFFFFLLPYFEKFKRGWIAGLMAYSAIAAIGGILTHFNTITNDPASIHQQVIKDDVLIVSLEESLVPKSKSFKANANVISVIRDDDTLQVKGGIIIYFGKDSLQPGLQYGSMIAFRKPLQEIRNSGNPGGFDYERYCLFQGITHQIYLKEGEFVRLSDNRTTFIGRLLESTRNYVLSVLRKFISGEKESGLAEALLIGYKNDLDKDLIQSYSNTGVVHVIAISGLHIGLIYAVLMLLLKPLGRKKQTRWMQPLLVIAGLWGFSLLAGASPSVMRSAVMFTCIVLGKTFSRKSSIYNTMAFSAFGLLCYNPFWLWDAGFQLSYIAVLSIIIFMKPIYNLFYVKNKLLDNVWKLNAVTIAAQILTLPVSIYHFHQFPNYFILTNIVAVPLSSAIVLGEILLCALGSLEFLSPASGLLGKLLSWMIRMMNEYVSLIELLPSSVWEGLQISLIQAILLYVIIMFVALWLMRKSRMNLALFLLTVVAFFALRSWSFFERGEQRSVVVYNIPRHSAIDFFIARSHFFVGDSACLSDPFIKSFHLKPSRTIARTLGGVNETSGNKTWRMGNKRIMLVSEAMEVEPEEEKPTIDLIILSRSPRLYISKLSEIIDIRQIVFDSSVPAWRMAYWKRDCDSLGIPWHDVSKNGAFVMNLN